MPNGQPPPQQPPPPDDAEQFDIQNQDHWDNAPSEFKDHFMAAMLHAAGHGPHPGKYKGRKPEPPPEDAITEGDLQRAHEAGYGKMRAAQRGSGDVGLGPTEAEQKQAQQTQALAQRAAAAGQIQATQAQSQQMPVNAPPAPTGPVGTTAPYPAQRGTESPAQGAPEEEQA